MRGSTRKVVRDYGGAILVAVIAALLIRFFVIEAYRIPTSAMHPTLEPGDTIFVAKWPFGLRVPGSRGPARPGRIPNRGEVVVYSLPGEPGRDYIKRVVGLPGDTIEVRQGRLFVDGRPAGVERSKNAPCAHERLDSRDAPVSYGVCWEPPLIEDSPATKVPEGQVFVLGDFRSQPPGEARAQASSGERRRSWGLVPVEELKGKALWVWLSIEPHYAGMSSPWFPSFRFERMFRRIE